MKGKLRKDLKFFRQFLIRYNTLSWENGADFAPEFLCEKLVQQNIEAANTATYSQCQS